MIVGRCVHCNYVACYNSKYFSISELQRHVISEIVTEQGYCIHDVKYEEEEKF